jgi:hypothetical protein
MFGLDSVPYWDESMRKATPHGRAKCDEELLTGPCPGRVSELLLAGALNRAITGMTSLFEYEGVQKFSAQDISKIQQGTEMLRKG